jgi:hypothetical protein
MGCFAITTVRVEPNNTNLLGVNRCRTVGLYPTFEDADRVLRNNAGHLNEDGHWPYAVIESVGWGLYPMNPKLQQWYQYSSTSNGWVSLEEIPQPVKDDWTAYRLVWTFHGIG